jgi:lipopolysaccharide export LptBFGC system permease protein LptF
MQWIFPAVFLLGVLLTLFRLARRREFTALEVAGASPYPVLVTILLLAVLFMGTQGILELKILPSLREKAQIYYQKAIEKKTEFTEGERFYRIEGNRFYYYFPTEKGTGWEVYTLSPDSFQYERAEPSSRGDFLLYRFSYPPGTTSLTVASLSLPHNLSRLKKTPETYSVSDLFQEIKRAKENGGDPFLWEFTLFHRFLWILFTLTLILPALPFLPHHGRRAETTTGIFIALGIAGGGWVLLHLGETFALDKENLLFLFLPHGIFLLLALFLSLRKGSIW